MVLLLDALLAVMSALLGQAPAPELHHVDLQTALLESAAGRRARSELEALQAKLQSESERREEQIAVLRKRSDISHVRADLQRLSKAIEAHAAASASATERLAQKQDTALAPLLRGARERMAAAQKPGRVLVAMEDTPLVGAPPACDRTDALRKALDLSAELSLPGVPECRVQWVVALGFDGAVKASKAGALAAQRVEELRARLQSELDAKRRGLEGLSAEMRYAGELELAEQFERNQSRLRMVEEEEEGKLYTRLAARVASIRSSWPGVRFVDSDAFELAGTQSCRAEDWSREVLDGGGETPRLMQLCGFRPRE